MATNQNFSSIKEVNGEKIDALVIPQTIESLADQVTKMLAFNQSFLFLRDAGVKPRISITTEGVVTVHCTAPAAHASTAGAKHNA